MTYSIEEERDSLWLEVENLTGVRFINRKKPPEALSEYSDEAKEAIKKLKTYISESITVKMSGGFRG